MVAIMGRHAYLEKKSKLKHFTMWSKRVSANFIFIIKDGKKSLIWMKRESEKIR